MSSLICGKNKKGMLFLKHFIMINTALGIIIPRNSVIFTRSTYSMHGSALFSNKLIRGPVDAPDPLIESIVRSWVMQWVHKLGLCPWAGQVLVQNRLRIVTIRDDPLTPRGLEAMEAKLIAESKLLLPKTSDTSQSTPKSIESPHTTLLVLPKLNESFDTFLSITEHMEGKLEEYDLDADIQIASFHPEYQFAETPPGSVENYTNRSPYAILHLLQVEQVAEAIASVHGDTSYVYKKNIILLKAMGLERVQKFQQSILQQALQTHSRAPP
jgi:hypothetical protein